MKEKGRILSDEGIDSALPELERMLVTAAAAQVKESKATFARRLATVRGPRLAAIVLGCLAFGGTAMAATGVWSPATGTEPPNTGGGSALSGEAPPTIVTNPVPAGLSGALGILRRDPNAADHGAEVEATLAKLSFVDQVRPDSVRFVAPGERGEATIVLSAEKSAFAGPGETKLACVVRPGANGYGHSYNALETCVGLPKLLAGRGYGEFVDLHTGSGLAFGLVPDGVSTVTAEFRNAPDVTVPVTDNYFEIPLSGAEMNSGVDLESAQEMKEVAVQRVTWRDSSDAVVPQRADDGESGTPAWTIVRLRSSPGGA